MVTIITRVIPATDTKPTRIVARFGDVGWGDRRSTVAFDYSLSSNENHLHAARKLWAEWSGPLDANYIGAGDNHRFAERVHLLKAFAGTAERYTAPGGNLILPIDV